MDGTYQGVRGFVTRAEHVEHLGTYDDIYKSLRLDYPDSAFNPATDETLGIIRYTTDEIEKISIPYGADMGGSVPGDPPFTGNGFTGAVNGEIIPEYECSDYLNISDGAELWEIGKDGTKTLRAVYSDADKGFIPVK